LTNKKVLAAALTTVVLAALGAAMPGTASATGSHRPCGPPVTTSGHGTLGTSWNLKSMHDDDGPGGSLVVGEEFEINTQVAGQLWTITFADNGTVFFTGDDVSAATGVREVHAAPNQPGIQHMTVHAVNHDTGEAIDGAVDVPPAPDCGGH
jgi:hypothetical protein